MSIIIFVIILGALIFVHELGHFLLAKKNGIRVDEFAIGFPPRLISYKKGETRYSLNLIPFGGYVKIFGENPDEKSLDPEAKDSFVNKSRWVQASVLVAGVVFNLIFAWVLFAVVLMSGMPSIVENEDDHLKYHDVKVVIMEVFEDSPADRAGLKPGNAVTSIRTAKPNFDINTNDTTLVRPSILEIQNLISSSDGEIYLTVLQNQNQKDIIIQPETDIIGEQPAIGISMEMIGYKRLPFFRAIWESFFMLLENIKLVFVGLSVLIGGLISGSADMSQVAGPIGIVNLVGNAAQFGLINLFSFTAMLSINLAVINILPIPALDGGRLLFLSYEGIRKKRIKPSVSNFVNAAGFIILIGLMIAITFSDIIKAF